MKVEIFEDVETQSFYLKLRSGMVTTTREGSVLVDYDTDGRLCGVEVRL